MAGLDELRSMISETHAEHPQRQWMALRAFDELKAAIHSLASFGHRLALIEDEDPEPVEWPKMFYHANHGSLTVASPEDAESLGEGWQDKPIGFVEAAPKAEESEPAAPAPKPVSVDIASFVAMGKAKDNEVPAGDSAKPEEK